MEAKLSGHRGVYCTQNLEHRTLRLNRGDSHEAWLVIRFLREVIRDAKALFA